jgi:hypothetical protein
MMETAAARKISKVLEDLIVLANKMIPKINVFAPDELAPLEQELTALVRRPCEDERILDDAALMLITALKHLCGFPRPRAARKWVAIAEALLDQVRGDAVLALEAEHGVITSEAQR